ncbi:MAG: hypothetical protein WCF95_02565 [bacterium]
MKILGLPHNTRIITKASETEMPKAKKLAEEVDKLLYYPGTYNKNDSYHFSQEMPDFMASKLVVKVKDDVAELAVKIKRYWLGIPKTVKTSLDLKSTDEIKKAEVLAKFKEDVKALTETMNYKYGTDPDSSVFSPW